jgi:AcrR family transcriptional regulator
LPSRSEQTSYPGVDPRKGPRRRGAVLERAILQAALDELTDVGYARLTMDRVAARANTNKTAIYRRWPSRAALAIATYRQLVAAPGDPPDTGDLRSDVLTLLRTGNARIASPQGEILRGLVAGMRDEPDLIREAREQFLQGGLGTWLTILGRAVARGQARPEALTPRIATVAADLLRNEYVFRGVTAIPDSTIVEIVDQIYLPLVQKHP